MIKRKIFIRSIIAILILSGCVFFLRPRSFADVSQEVESISVSIIDDRLEYDTTSYVYSAQEPEFSAIIETLDRYSYHVSLGTIPSYLGNRASLEGNQAGYWLYIYLYTEPDRYGDCYGIILGGTNKVIVDDAVYCIGYFGNSTALKMMDEVCQLVTP